MACWGRPGLRRRWFCDVNKESACGEGEAEQGVMGSFPEVRTDARQEFRRRSGPGQRGARCFPGAPVERKRHQI